MNDTTGSKTAESAAADVIRVQSATHGLANAGTSGARRCPSTWATRSGADGAVVSDAPGFQGAPGVCADGRVGAIATWSDGRDGRHIHARRAGGSRRLGAAPSGARPAPTARGIRVPGSSQ